MSGNLSSHVGSFRPGPVSQNIHLSGLITDTSTAHQTFQISRLTGKLVFTYSNGLQGAVGGFDLTGVTSAANVGE